MPRHGGVDRQHGECGKTLPLKSICFHVETLCRPSTPSAAACTCIVALRSSFKCAVALLASVTALVRVEELWSCGGDILLALISSWIVNGDILLALISSWIVNSGVHEDPKLDELLLLTESDRTVCCSSQFIGERSSGAQKMCRLRPPPRNLNTVGPCPLILFQ